MAIEDRDGEDGPEIRPSELDDKTHTELCGLYQDAAAALRFAKERQWKLLGGALLVFVAIMALPELLAVDPVMAQALVFLSFLVSAAAIYILVIYQVWQNSELGRLRAISTRFSSLFAELGGPRARRESKVHGYIILFFMIAGVIAANGVTALFLSRLYL